METKAFSRNSLTYRFLAYPRTYLESPPQDICELTRAVIFRSILLLLCLLIATIYVSSVPYYLYAGSYCGFSLPDPKNLSEFSTCTLPWLKIYDGPFFVGMILTCATSLILVIIGMVFSWKFTADALNTLRTKLRKRAYLKHQALLKDPNYKEPVPKPRRRNIFKEMYRSHKEKTCFRITFN